MNLTIKDERSQNLMNGLLLLFQAYPDGAVSLDENKINFVMPHTNKNLSEEQYKQLVDWGWDYDVPHYLKRCSWWEYCMG